MGGGGCTRIRASPLGQREDGQGRGDESERSPLQNWQSEKAEKTFDFSKLLFYITKTKS